MTILILGFGLFSLTKLKVTLFPSVNIPVLAVSTNYSNVAAEDINEMLVKPLEGAVSSVNGVDELSAYVRRGGTFIVLRLQEGTDIRRTELQVRKAIDRVRSELPNEASEPVIFQFDPESRPIMNLSVEAEGRGLEELRELATQRVEQQIERLPGIASADTRGGLNRKIFINIDQQSLAQYNLQPEQVLNALRQNNVRQAIGNITTNRQSYSVRAESIFTSVDQIRQTVITTTDEGVAVHIGDVADVEDGFEDIQTLVEVNGNNSVTIEVHKQSDANTLDAVKSVSRTLGEIEKQLPAGVNLQILTSEGDNIENSINNLSQTALIALVVVILILLLFMGGWRVSLIVASAIPVSVTATFAAMYFADLTLNIFSITAIALAVGLLVDNAIVVSESIAGKLEKGHSRYDAALLGTNEVIGALLGSTLTTVAVFLPIVSISGVAGQVFRDFALTICMAIAISFLVSILLLPVLAVLFMDAGEFEKHSFTFKALHRLEDLYIVGLKWILQKRWIVLLFVALIMGGSYFIYQELPGGFFPDSDEGEFDVEVELPPGTKLVKTAEILRDYSQRILDMDMVTTVVTEIGQSGFRTESNTGEITVKLIEPGKRDQSTNEISREVERMLQRPGVELEVGGRRGGRGGFGGFGNRIRFTLIGPEIEVLQALADKITRVAETDTNVISVNTGRSDPIPELHYKANRTQVNKAGGNLSNVASALQTQMRGSRAGYYYVEGREIPIEVRSHKSIIDTREKLLNLHVLSSGDLRLPVSALGRFDMAEGTNRYERRDRETILDINIRTQNNASEYRDQLVNFIRDNVVLPSGYRYEFTGTTRQSSQSESELLWVLLFALMLTYMVMASLFENFRDPFVIWLTIPLAFFGALMALWITGTNVYVTAYIGILMLVGIVVNNGIVLVDYIHLYTRDNKSSNSYYDNFIEACRRRMRPILLTALTTVCSMIPLSFELGAGAETWAPLARAVIGGLIFATILTLFVVPSVIISISKKRREAIRDKSAG